MIIKRIEDWYTSKKVTEVTTIIGNTGYGKTYCAGKIVEKYIEEGWPFCIVDKMGIHFVIRAEFTDVVIVGGQYADYTLEQIDEVLPLLLDENINFVLDVSELDESVVCDFVEGFFEHMYEWHKEHRKPRNYVIEECDAFMGQTGTPAGVKNMITKCITKGRMYGFGFTLLSQRFRMIDKTGLGQTKNYLVFNIKLTNDLTLLKNLVGEDVSSKVRRLPMGKCLIMTEEWHGIYSVGTKKSPDEAVTPEIGVVLKDIKVKPLSDKIRNKLEN